MEQIQSFNEFTEVQLQEADDRTQAVDRKKADELVKQAKAELDSAQAKYDAAVKARNAIPDFKRAIGPRK